jgi:hypothetical protein
MIRDPFSSSIVRMKIFISAQTQRGRIAQPGFCPLKMAGGRVQFTDTLKAARIYDGNVGTIAGIDARTGLIRARLDSTAAGRGREVTWSAAEFIGFRHGYAGTIYRGQGRTLDHPYLYHSHHWRSAASYARAPRCSWRGKRHATHRISRGRWPARRSRRRRSPGRHWTS